MTRTLLYFRIAFSIGWSIFFGIVAVLLIMLSVRSRTTIDEVVGSIGRLRYFVTSEQSRLAIYAGVDGPMSGLALPLLQHESAIDDDPSLTQENLAVHTDALGFGRDHGPLITKKIVPTWFAVASMAIVASLPWLPFKRFSLRTLLIAITLGCLGLGLIVWLIR